MDALSQICPRLDIIEADASVLHRLSINISTLRGACQNYTAESPPQLGERRGPLSKVIPITVVYCLIFFTGLVGNITTCFVIACNRYMHTATNYYLFNLAITDILVLILGLPQELYTFWSAYPWIFGEAFCVIRTFAAESCSNASILSITAFTIERYIAICHPLRSKLFSLSKLSRSLKIIAGLWVISCLCSIPMTLQFGLEYMYDKSGNKIPESLSCTRRKEFVTSFELSTFLFFLTPMTIILVLYILMGMAIFQTSKDGHREGVMSGYETRAMYNKNQRLRSRRSAIKLLVAVVVAFFVCWAPFHAQRLMAIYVKKWSRKLLAIQDILYYISGVLYYVSSTINPLLYNIMSIKFRKAFKTTLSTCCTRRRKNRAAISYNFKMTTRTLPGSSSRESLPGRYRGVYQPDNGQVNRLAKSPTKQKLPIPGGTPKDCELHCHNGPCTVP